MSKNERIFRIIAVTGLIVGTIALVRREAEIKILNNTYEMIHQYITDERFAEIVQHYDEDGEGN